MRSIAARAVACVEAELAGATAHFGLPAHAAVRSCYEAGRDGFWLHRYLRARGVANDVVDSSRIAVNRRARRAKSDRLDAGQLVTMLRRADAGERRVWSVLRVPSVAEEDRRQLHRELLFVRRDRARLTNRIKGLLANQGLVVQTLADLPTPLAMVRRWDGAPRPLFLRARLERAWNVVAALTQRLRALRAERRALLETSDDPARARPPTARAPRHRPRDRVALCPGVLRVADLPQSPGGRRPRRAGAHALPERRRPARAGSEAAPDGS